MPVARSSSVVLAALLLAGCQQFGTEGSKPGSQVAVTTASRSTENQVNEAQATRQVTIAISGMV